ncbi:TPA: Cna B-type domain-containing protein, partial [Bacillus cereus]
NTYKNTETTEVSGKKVWNDSNAIDRPVSIKVDLLQNGKVIDTREVSVSTNWKYTFERLQIYDANGVAYKYEVEEQPVDGYQAEVNGYDITNTKIKNVDPQDPENPKDDTKVPPIKENQEKSSWLPKSGGISTGITQLFWGIISLVLGGILLLRRKGK